MRRATGLRTRRTEKQWREILGRFEASGLSSREFCKREGLTVSSLQRWRSRCGRAAVPQFVELTPSSATPATPSTGWALELELPDGVRLRLRG